MDNSDFFQRDVHKWLVECLGSESAKDTQQRAHRFLEEALELYQAAGCTQKDAERLCEYVFSRDKGEVQQEVGGVMLTLAALATSADQDITLCGIAELARMRRKIDTIRTKDATKPVNSPLPGDDVCSTCGGEGHCMGVIGGPRGPIECMVECYDCSENPGRPIQR